LENKAVKPIGLIKTGCTIEQIRPQCGDFEDWFAKAMGYPALRQFDVFRHEPLPDPDELSGVLVTGSAAMVSERQDWSEQTAQWLAQVVRQDVPVLGVCYGHQLLAHALGGEVGPNPSGRQIGTVRVETLAAAADDPLLAGLPTSLPANATHSEVVLSPPGGATRLARSALDENFALRFAERAWGVQFHPEFSEEVMQLYLHYRADVLRQEGLDPDALMKATSETRAAAAVLPSFVNILREA
jgi:GMP synthase (glutamine-hydrolysing)